MSKNLSCTQAESHYFYFISHFRLLRVTEITFTLSARGYNSVIILRPTA